MPETITLKLKSEVIEEALANLDVNLDELEVTLFPKCNLLKKPQYHGEMIQVYFYDKNKEYPANFVGNGLKSLQKFFDVDRKTATLVLIAKMKQLSKELAKSEEIREKRRILKQLDEKTEKIIMEYPLPRYKVKCQSCGRTYKTRHRDRKICYACFNMQRVHRKPKAEEPKKKPEQKNFCKRCNSPIPAKFTYCLLCKQILDIEGGEKR